MDFPGRSVKIEKGGLTLSFEGRTVSLRRARLTNEASMGLGNGRVTTERSVNFDATPVRAIYLLGRGETWSVTKAGKISVDG